MFKKFITVILAMCCILLTVACARVDNDCIFTDSAALSCKSDAETESDQSAEANYYRTSSGKRYHLDPDCGGKNSYQTTNISDLIPCAKCAE